MKSTLPFSERHPKLNFIIGLLMLLGIIAASVLFLKWLIFEIGTGLLNAIAWLKSVASSLDAVIIVALITGSISMISVIFTSVVGKIIEYNQKRLEYLYKKRELPYYKFIEMVYKIQGQVKSGQDISSDELINDMSEFSQQLTLWGSNKVIKKYIKFREISMNQANTKNILFASEDLMYAMRSDMGLHKMQRGLLLGISINDIKNVLNKTKK